jgi:hypothetical protein
MMDTCKVIQVDKCKFDCMKPALVVRIGRLRDLLAEAKLYAVASGAQGRLAWIDRADAALADPEPVDFIRIP